MHHNLVAIDRLDWRYWLDGDGAWATRWDSVNHDWLLAVLQLAAMTWMVKEYVHYAIQCNQAVGIFNDPKTKLHVLRLKAVLIQCVMINLFTSVLAWVWTPHYLLVCLIFYNAHQTRKLNHSKTDLLQSQQQKNDEKIRVASLAAYDVLNCDEMPTVDRLEQARCLLMATITKS